MRQKTRSHSKARAKPKRSARASRPRDALSLLRKDHREASSLFQQLLRSRSASKKKDLASQICIGLSVHMRLEEDLFYPQVKQALKEKDRELIPEARVEHASLKKLITEVETAELDEEFDARMQVMGEYVKHHVKEEETRIFPKARASSLDLKDLGLRLQDRKQQLMQQLSAEEGRPRTPRSPLPSSIFGESAPQYAEPWAG